MARKQRCEFEGAVYHIINRGNYRRDLFETTGASRAFLRTLEEAAFRYRWVIHAFVLMKDHYHLALRTPEANLVDGMHWLQSTYATRFNRFRNERGHLFQGRYKSLLIEDDIALGRVVDYIHLNPVRAGVVPAREVGKYERSSLSGLLRDAGPCRIQAEVWLRAIGDWSADEQGIRAYEKFLIDLAGDGKGQSARGLLGLSTGWAIGTRAWEQAVAKKLSAEGSFGNLSREEAQGIREVQWEAALGDLLDWSGRTSQELSGVPMRQDWKIELAFQLRRTSGASAVWIATRLNLGKPSSVRSYLARYRRGVGEETSGSNGSRSPEIAIVACGARPRGVLGD